MPFTDAALQDTFDQNGFVVIDLLDASDINALKKIYQQFPAKQVADFQVSNYEKDAAKNKLIDEEIKSIIAPKIAAYVNNYRLLSAYFYIKYATENSSFYIHKDWNVVDESKHQSMHIWIPLTDTNRENGNLFFCPYEYKRGKKTYRGSPGFEYPKTSLTTNFINKIYQKDVYTKAGQAICFKHNMTHGSRTNKTDRVRVAAGISLIFDNAPMLHYHQKKDGTIYEFEVQDDFYLDFDLNTMPENYKSIKTIEV
ncbi:MAG: phytanoyl-CoA dioxygenase family protein [Chitinophagales bacterium]